MNNAEWNSALCYTINSSYVITVEYTGSMEFIDGQKEKGEEGEGCAEIDSDR